MDLNGVWVSGETGIQFLSWASDKAVIPRALLPGAQLETPAAFCPDAGAAHPAELLWHTGHPLAQLWGQQCHVYLSTTFLLGWCKSPHFPKKPHSLYDLNSNEGFINWEV